MLLYIYVPGVVCPTRVFSLTVEPDDDWHTFAAAAVVAVVLVAESSLVTTIELYHATVQSQPTKTFI